MFKRIFLTFEQHGGVDFHRRLRPSSLLPPLPETEESLDQSEIYSISHLAYIIHEEAFSPAFAHGHREAGGKQVFFRIQFLKFNCEICAKL